MLLSCQRSGLLTHRSSCQNEVTFIWSSHVDWSVGQHSLCLPVPSTRPWQWKWLKHSSKLECVCCHPHHLLSPHCAHFWDECALCLQAAAGQTKVVQGLCLEDGSQVLSNKSPKFQKNIKKIYYFVCWKSLKKGAQNFNVYYVSSFVKLIQDQSYHILIDTLCVSNSNNYYNVMIFIVLNNSFAEFLLATWHVPQGTVRMNSQA